MERSQVKFDSAYKAKALNNWELPKWHPPRPRQRKGSTKVIANDRGHLLERNFLKPDQNPFGDFRNTYQLPDKINRDFVEKYNNSLLKKDKWSAFPEDTNICDNSNSENLGIAGTGLSCPTKFQANDEIHKFKPHQHKRLSSCEKKNSLDLEYIPGDLTPFKSQQSTRDFLLEDKYKRDNHIETDFLLDKNYLGDHECKLGECEPPAIKLNHLLPQTSALVKSNLSPKRQDLEISDKCHVDSDDDYLNINNTNKMFGYHSITEKPNERCPSPVVPAYANFQQAKRMHSNNLDHQPLPDCVADLAFRKLQITGANPGLALDIDPITTGVGIKTHNAGPTHCTKLKVYRPKTAGVIPKALNGYTGRSFSATPSDKKMSAMDLAICWDYKPTHEPPIPKRIDGSNDSAGPAVFTYVRTPRDDAIITTDHSSGVFANTLGDTGFFDKDVLGRKTDFGGRKISTDDFSNDIDVCPTFPRSRSASRGNTISQKLAEPRFSKQYKSTPDMLADQEYKALREKYLGADCGFPTQSTEPGCKRAGLMKKARSRLCHKIAPETNCCSSICPPKRMTCKTAFRAGVPRYNAAGNFISSDSGCSMGSNHSQRVLVVPRPRNPYTKRYYDIDTLVPPFQSYAGGSGEGGYPEHWRLASVYQHAYKPLECRRKPLLQTVYK